MRVANVRLTTSQEEESFKQKQFGKGINAAWQIDSVYAVDIYSISDNDTTRWRQEGVIKKIWISRRLQKGCFVGAYFAI